jgi:hypothetical protein
MSREGPRHWEDYIYGSSDHPAYGDGDRPRLQEESLTKTLSEFTVRFYAPDGTLDRERTNEWRKRYVEEKRLLPVLQRKGKILYRHVTADAGGLLDIAYGEIMPERIEALNAEERIPARSAAAYLGIDMETMKKKRECGQLRGTRGYVNLSDVNKIKFQSP